MLKICFCPSTQHNMAGVQLCQLRICVTPFYNFIQPFQAMKSTLKEIVLPADSVGAIQKSSECSPEVQFWCLKCKAHPNKTTKKEDIFIYLFIYSITINGLFWCVYFNLAKLCCISQVIQGLLAVFYNLGDGEYNLTLPFQRLDDGEWHEVEVDRYGKEFTLRLDGGGGQREITASPGQSQEIIIDPSVVMLGNSFPSGHNRSFTGRCLPIFRGMRLKSVCWKICQINGWLIFELPSSFGHMQTYSSYKSEHHS